MNKDSILDMFFNDILPSIAEGDLWIDGARYNINFNTVIYSGGSEKHMPRNLNPKLPILTIKDEGVFSHLLLEFMYEVMSRDIKWCKPNIKISTKNEEIRYFLATMWTNMTASDFSDPEMFLRRYISFLRDETFTDLDITSGPIEKLGDCHLEISNVEEISCLETPYAMRVIIKGDDGQCLLLPDVKYGIEDVNGEKKAFIYAVQYDEKVRKIFDQDKSKQAKINRCLYKVDQDIPKDELDKKKGTQLEGIDSEENIVDVTPSALVSLTVALSLLADMGITKISVASYMPLRWDAKTALFERRISNLKEDDLGYPDQIINEMEQEFYGEQQRIQRNATDKLIRNFRRIEYHFNGLDITAFPIDVDDSMHLKLDADFKAYNPDHLLGEVSTVIMNYEKGNKVK